MPIYEFTCADCDAEFEVIVRTPDISKYSLKEAHVKCTECGGDAGRVMSVTAPPRFRGSGFYQTDYKEK